MNYEEGDSQDYNWSKYSDISDLKKSDPAGNSLPQGLSNIKENKIPALGKTQENENMSNPQAYRENSKSNSSRS